MKYLKKSVNQFVEGKKTLKKGQPIYPLINLKVDENGNRIGMFYDKLMIDEDTTDTFEQFILKYLRTDEDEHIITNYVTRQQLKRIKGIQNLTNFIDDLYYNGNNYNLNFAKYFPNLKHFVFPNSEDQATESLFNYIFKHKLDYISTVFQASSHKIKTSHHHVSLNYLNREIKTYAKITYLNNIYYSINRTSNMDVMCTNFLCGIQVPYLKLNADIIQQFQNSGNFSIIDNLEISCYSIKPLSFYKSNIKSIKLKFNDEEFKTNIIRNSSFYNCKMLQKVILENVKKLQFGAFSHCYNLEKIYIHSNNRVFLSSYCFYCCYHLTDIYFDYIPRFSLGLGGKSRNNEYIYPYVILHGKFTNQPINTGDGLCESNYNYLLDTQEHINTYCEYINKIFAGCLLYSDLNIHIKNKSDSIIKHFKWLINEYNNYILENHEEYVGRINII